VNSSAPNMPNDIKKPKIAANILKISPPPNEYLNNSFKVIDLLENSLKNALTMNPVKAAKGKQQYIKTMKKILITSMNIT
jgi:hypothetical protein